MIQISSLTVTQRQEYLIAIEDAIASAVDYVQFNGQQVKFRSLDDMFRIRSFLRDSLGLNKSSKSMFSGPKRAVVRTGNNV